MTLKKSHKKNSKTYSWDKASAKEYDKNGYFLVTDNPISKSGVFQYLGRNIPNAPDPDKMYNVYRPESELNNPETIKSAQLLPIIDDHEMLGEGATPAERKGIHGVTGEDVHFKNGVLYANLKVLSETLKEKIDGGKKELSCGFYNEWKQERGNFEGKQYDYIQTDILFNHIALVDAGRMGKDVAVLDEKDNPKNKGVKMDAEMKKEVMDMIKDAMSNYSKDMEEKKKSEDMEKEKKKSEDEEAKKEDEKKSEDAKKEEDEKAKSTDSKEQSFDAKDFEAKTQKSINDAIAADRIEQKSILDLQNKAKPHVGSFDAKDTLEDTAVYVADKLGMACDPKDALAMVNGYLSVPRQETKVITTSMDSMDSTNSVNAYLKGE